MSILIKNVILENQKKDILIEENKIKKIDDQINDSADEVIDVKREKAILPGFVNAHTHVAMTLLRGYADDLPLNEWLFDKIFPAEAKINNEDVYWGTKLALIEMIKSGTTFINEMYLFRGLEGSARAIEEMGIRAILGICVDDFNFDQVKKFELPLNTDLIDYCIAPHAIYTASEETLRWAKDFSDKNNLLIHMHLSETQKEVSDSIEKYGKRPVNYLADMGFLNDKCVFAHSVWLNNEELEILKENGCSLIYNPCSNMKLASGVFRFDDIRKKGINICLGTDGAASNNNLDMFDEMKIGSLLQKVNNIDPESAKAEDILKVATENGGKALGKKTGKIEEGYLADLILIDLKQTYFNPCYNFISSIVYASKGDCVSDVICNGKIIMRDRKIKGEEEVYEKVKEISKKFN
ncbi:MAG: amidohydrolase [Candidatus Pacebacteria bacterium]|nr:amidohydrolase [Candidatus Paceibacterota bacterium]MDD3919150.1 amidohydrolase [Candidatus Paceibacterota bacterium]